jgi:HEAT repeat protein
VTTPAGDADAALDPAALERQRAVALAGHTGDEAHALAALGDPEAGVRARALGALERLGALDDAVLQRALDDPDPAVRRRAAALSASRPAVPLLGLLDDPDPAVIEVAAFALGEQARPDRVTVERLAGLAVEHRDPLVREAAVAALGAIGDRRGLPAVLAATDDKPAVRRRAVIALAAFEGPEVDAALERALTDRDWQVRQAAEDLTDVDSEA